MGCSGHTSDTQENLSSAIPENKGNLSSDMDHDGKPDNEDQWPNDNTRPEISSLAK